MDQSELLLLVAEGKEAWNKWARINGDTKADFSGLDFDNDVTFDGFRFPNDTSFSEATFTGDAPFSEATFTGNAFFSGATFTGDAFFNGATFTGDASFSGATFKGAAFSNGATFTGTVFFSEATFMGDAGFREATFTGGADFREATFTGDANFQDTTFTGAAFFRNTTFTGTALFSGATFTSTVFFSEATFTGTVYFSEATFNGDAFFNKATFTGNTSFVSIDVQVRIDFEDTEFHCIPDFHAAKNPERIALDAVEFSLPKPSGRFSKIVNCVTGLGGSDRSTMIRIRQIRGIANKNHAIDTERDLAILERNAQVGAAWSGLNKFKPFQQWVHSVLITLFSTPLLVLYRGTSNYGRSVKLPLFWLVTTPLIWFCVHFKLYLMYGIPGRYLLSDKEFSAIKSITLFGAFPISATQRPAYTTAVETLSGGSTSAGLPFALQVSLTLQSITSLIFLFLIGLALRNFFRMK